MSRVPTTWKQVVDIFVTAIQETGWCVVEGMTLAQAVEIVEKAGIDPATVTMIGGTLDARPNATEPCPAKIHHGPGHQSRTECKLTGEHDVHEAHVGGRVLRWRTGDYTNSLRAEGIEFDSRSYPESMGMTGFFDESPLEED